MKRVCAKCGEAKALEQFRKDLRGLHRGQCKACDAAKANAARRRRMLERGGWKAPEPPAALDASIAWQPLWQALGLPEVRA